MEKLLVRNPGLQRGFGCLGALLQVGLSISDIADEGPDILVPVYLAIALLFVASAIIPVLVFLQVTLCFSMSAIITASSLNCFLGLGFSLAAAIMVFRLGGFLRQPMIKAAFFAFFGSLALTVPIFCSNKPALAHIPALIVAAIYSVLVYCLARGRVLSAFGPKKKPVLKLAAHGLGAREIQVILATIGGATIKQIAYDLKLSESTIRNTLARGRHKLGLDTREDVGALRERYRVE